MASEIGESAPPFHGHGTCARPPQPSGGPVLELGRDDDAAFRKGLALAAEPGGPLNHLFAVRAEGLLDAVPEAGLRSYLSGIVIGDEVRALCGLARPEGPVTRIGRSDLTRLYAEAIGPTGPSVLVVTSQDATLKRLSALRKAM